MNRSLLSGLRGLDVYDRTGARIGRVHSYDELESPDWLSVALGFFGQKKTFVPATMVQYSYGRVIVACSKESVLAAPSFRRDEAMTEADEEELVAHYGVGVEQAKGVLVQNAEELQGTVGSSRW